MHCADIFASPFYLLRQVFFLFNQTVNLSFSLVLMFFFTSSLSPPSSFSAPHGSPFPAFLKWGSINYYYSYYFFYLDLCVLTRAFSSIDFDGCLFPSTFSFRLRSIFFSHLFCVCVSSTLPPFRSFPVVLVTVFFFIGHI